MWHSLGATARHGYLERTHLVAVHSLTRRATVVCMVDTNGAICVGVSLLATPLAVLVMDRCCRRRWTHAGDVPQSSSGGHHTIHVEAVDNSAEKGACSACSSLRSEQSIHGRYEPTCPSTPVQAGFTDRGSPAVKIDMPPVVPPPPPSPLSVRTIRSGHYDEAVSTLEQLSALAGGGSGHLVSERI